MARTDAKHDEKTDQPFVLGRRDFLAASGVSAVAVLIPSTLFGCGGTEGGAVRNEAWEKRAAELEGKGTVYTLSQPAKWKGKEKGHAPTVKLNRGAGSVTVTTAHGMSDSHWITTLYLRDQSGVVVGLKEFAGKKYTGDEAKRAEATFTLPAGTSMIVAYSYCNLHDHWKSTSTTTS